MSVFASLKRPLNSKVPASQYIKSNIKADDVPNKIGDSEPIGTTIESIPTTK
jgi:hypothetical protein